jgi:hypothetical protein
VKFPSFRQIPCVHRLLFLCALPAARAVVDKNFSRLVDVETGQTLDGQAKGDKMVFELTLPPATYRVLSAE